MYQTGETHVRFYWYVRFWVITRRFYHIWKYKLVFNTASCDRCWWLTVGHVVSLRLFERYLTQCGGFVAYFRGLPFVFKSFHVKIQPLMTSSCCVYVAC